MTMLPEIYTSHITLEGPDTVALLERLLTCRVEGLTTGERVLGALLTPQGKVLADFLLERTEAGARLDVSPDIAADLEKRLKLFRLRADVEIARTDGAAAKIDHAARIASVCPVFRIDFGTASVFPTDVNLDIGGGIDYKKGCFVGQEVVSRMARRGKIRKRTVRLDGSGLEAGTDVMADGKRLGTVTSASEVNALAVLRIDHLAAALDAGGDLTVGEQIARAHRPDWLLAEMEALADGKG